MNSRERMLTVLRHELPDRVPLMELWIDPVVVHAILPGASSNELAAHLGMDVVTVPTMIYADSEIEWVDRDQGLFRDKWGALQALTHDAVPVPAKPPRIETDKDLAGYIPPDPRQSPVVGEVRALKQLFPAGEKAIAVVGESGWAPAVYLRGGLENLLMDLALRPGFAKELMRIGMAYYTELYRLAIAAGADIVLLGDDYADKRSTMMSPAHFEDVVLPGDAAVVAAIKDAGGYCIKHTDGNITGIMDMLVGTGLDALGPLEPVPGMELAKIAKRYDGRLTVMGNVDVDLLSRGSAAEVVAETKRLLAQVSANSPHIMSSGNSIASSVSPDNFVAMVNTTLEFGNYPIDVARLQQ